MRSLAADLDAALRALDEAGGAALEPPRVS